MFGSNQKKSSGNLSASGVSAVTGSSGINTLVAGTHAEGQIETTSDIRIDGSIKGSLRCKGRMIIGPEGKVDGDVTCTNAVIEGTFTGQLNVTEILDVRESARVLGDIKTGKLVVQTGAIFNGKCDMGAHKPRVDHVKEKSMKTEKVLEVPAS